jgi:hypothetical protein
MNKMHILDNVLYLRSFGWLVRMDVFTVPPSPPLGQGSGRLAAEQAKFGFAYDRVHALAWPNRSNAWGVPEHSVGRATGRAC